MVGTEIEELVGALDRRLAELPAERSHRATFLGTYRRTTTAVAAAVERGRFEDAGWVSRWTGAFGRYSLEAHDADLAREPVPRPWRLAFTVPADAHPLAHLLVSMNAHINFDLPQAMIDVLPPAEFADADLLAARVRDHDRIDAVLVSRIAAEDAELGGARRVVDRLLVPANRFSTRRMLTESRAKVWENVQSLHEARSAGVYGPRLAELEVLASARVVDLLRPGQSLLRLAVSGFGVRLPPA